MNRASEQSESREAEHCGVSKLSGASDRVAFFKTVLTSLDPRNFLIQLSKIGVQREWRYALIFIDIIIKFYINRKLSL